MTDANLKTFKFTIAAILRAYAAGEITVRQVVDESLRRIHTVPDTTVWISISQAAELRCRAEKLDHLLQTLPGVLEQFPLFGIPYGVKDNIDVSGLATTAACPGFSYQPKENAPVISLLERAGAICLGKTNMDQFATGLVGVRSPYGECPNAVNPEYISGGSSSGSAVAVAMGHVAFSLGTDTAGSGRIPAALNGIVGFKPTRGLLSTRGVVPACRSLDCVSVFSINAGDSQRVFNVLRQPDDLDEFSIQTPPPLQNPGALPRAFNIGVLRHDQYEFFGDSESARLYRESISRLRKLGANIVEIDYTPFLHAGELLYNGPWIVERFAGLKPFVQAHPEACLPIIRDIFSNSSDYSAQDVFQAMHRQRSLLCQLRPVWRTIRALMLPTSPTIYTRSEIRRDPIALNTNLGFYTRFVNLLDCSAIAVPAGRRANGLPWGISFVAERFAEHKILELASAFELPEDSHPVTASIAPNAAELNGRTVGLMDLAVVGAHLSGQPLNHQLTNLGAWLVRSDQTSPTYRLYLLTGVSPPKPGLVRVETDGVAIQLEIWRMPVEKMGQFLELVPPFLCIGNVELLSKSWVKGFLCEPAAIQNSRDISSYGGWRSYLIDTQRIAGYKP